MYFNYSADVLFMVIYCRLSAIEAHATTWLEGKIFQTQMNSWQLGSWDLGFFPDFQNLFPRFHPEFFFKILNRFTLD